MKIYLQYKDRIWNDILIRLLESHYALNYPGSLSWIQVTYGNIVNMARKLIAR